MGSIMQDYRKNKALFCCILSATMLSSWNSSYAGDLFVKIEQAKLTYTPGKAMLEADLGFQLSATAEDALHSGISLYWDVSLEIKQKQWPGVWYKTLLEQSHRYSLSYYTLLNKYRLRDEQNQVFIRFSNLSEALTYMRHIRYQNLPMYAYREDQCVTSVLNVIFDKEMLPAPLRPIAYFDQQWDLSANERQWCE